MSEPQKKDVPQGLLEDMFDAETVEQMKEAQADDVFPRVERIEPDYSCPRCGYGWKGNPKPPTGATIEDDTDEKL